MAGIGQIQNAITLALSIPLLGAGDTYVCPRRLLIIDAWCVSNTGSADTDVFVYNDSAASPSSEIVGFSVEANDTIYKLSSGDPLPASFLASRVLEQGAVIRIVLAQGAATGTVYLNCLALDAPQMYPPAS